MLNEADVTCGRPAVCDVHVHLQMTARWLQSGADLAINLSSHAASSSTHYYQLLLLVLLIIISIIMGFWSRFQRAFYLVILQCETQWKDSGTGRTE